MRKVISDRIRLHVLQHERYDAMFPMFTNDRHTNRTKKANEPTLHTKTNSTYFNFPNKLTMTCLFGTHFQCEYMISVRELAHKFTLFPQPEYSELCMCKCRFLSVVWPGKRQHTNSSLVNIQIFKRIRHERCLSQCSKCKYSGKIHW